MLLSLFVFLSFLMYFVVIFTRVVTISFGLFYYLLSHPLLRLMYGEYWFRLSCLSMMVIGSFAPYTKTKSVESAVWCLLTLDDDVETGSRYNGYFFCFTGSKYLNRVQGQNCSFSFEQQSTKLKWKCSKMNNQTTNKINEQIITNNNW
jgi:hypothetical protein